MIAYLLRSLAQAIVVMLAVALIAFSMFRFVGDPVANMVGQEASVAERQELAQRLGLNDPFPMQFAHFVRGAAQGEFGMSYRQGRPVRDLLIERAPATLELAVLSSAFALVLGIVLGVYTAIHRRGILANAVMSLSLLGVSLPSFLIGIGLIYLFAVELHWLPSFGRGDVVSLGGWTTGLLTESGRKSLIMPTLTLGFFQLTLIMRLVRAEMLEALRTDYVKFARARGIPERAISFPFRRPETRTLMPLHPKRSAESTALRMARRKPTRFSSWSAMFSATSWASSSGLCTSWMSTKTSRFVRFWSSTFSLSISAPLRPMMMPGRAVRMMMRSLLPGRSTSMELTPADFSLSFSSAFRRTSSTNSLS